MQSYYELLELNTKTKKTWPIPSSYTCPFFAHYLVITHEFVQVLSVAYLSISVLALPTSLSLLYFSLKHLFSSKKDKQNNQNKSKQKIIIPKSQIETSSF